MDGFEGVCEDGAAAVRASRGSAPCQQTGLDEVVKRGHRSQDGVEGGRQGKENLRSTTDTHMEGNYKSSTFFVVFGTNEWV